MDWQLRNIKQFATDFIRLKSSRPEKATTVLEVYLYEQNTSQIVIAPQQLVGDALKEWIKKSPPELNGASPIAGLRLVLSPRCRDANRVLHRFPFSTDTLKILDQNFGLDPSFARSILRAKPTLFPTSFSHKSLGHDMQGYLLRSNETGGEDVILSTALDQETRIMHAILHGCTKDDIVVMIEWLEILSPRIFHPLLLPALVVDLIKTKYARLIEEKRALLIEYAGTADQYDSVRSSNNPQLGGADDYSQVIQNILQLHQDIGDYEFAIVQTRKQVTKLVSLLEKNKPCCPATEDPEYNALLQERLEEILLVYDDLERLCSQITRDCDMLMGAIWNYIGQQQNSVNVKIADDSRKIAIAAKKDSEVMKAIGVLTMVFLPATFVASFFAMPLLNWPGGLTTEESQRVINPRFKYYWAVTLPLTLIVCLVWLLWARIISNSDMLTEKEAKSK